MKINNLTTIKHELSRHYKSVNQSPSFVSLMNLSNSFSQMGDYYNEHEEYSLATMCFRKCQIIRKEAIATFGNNHIQTGF